MLGEVWKREPTPCPQYVLSHVKHNHKSSTIYHLTISPSHLSHLTIISSHNLPDNWAIVRGGCFWDWFPNISVLITISHNIWYHIEQTIVSRLNNPNSFLYQMRWYEMRWCEINYQYIWDDIWDQMRSNINNY